MALSRRVLAIDPGSRVTGYGIIDVLGQEVRYVDSGCIRLADEEMPLRLMMIHQGITELIRSYRPQEFAIEAIFVHKNPASALKLGQARGVAICAAVLAQLPVAEYAAKSIKQAVVGKGGAEKTQVQHMVKILLNRSGVIQRRPTSSRPGLEDRSPQRAGDIPGPDPGRGGPCSVGATLPGLRYRDHCRSLRRYRHASTAAVGAGRSGGGHQHPGPGDRLPHQRIRPVPVGGGRPAY